MLGRQAWEEYGLDEVWFMPSHTPPHKTDHLVTGTKDRCEMVKLAIAEYPYFRFSDFEISRTGNTYTAQTLQLLKKHTRNIFSLSWVQIPVPHRKLVSSELVLGHVTILAAGRECEDASCSLEEQAEYLRNKYGAAIFLLHSDTMHVSSQELREQENLGLGIGDLVPASVERYIREHGLYQHPDRKEDTL